ncbi:hypothetical protein [Xanthomonas theicola]|uniref:hypothetical protein n=1 Tax=Xanthomonas theicola TaxID=56464 RepID=UPI000FF8AAD2|nr:hypothetical protein [Xanthomonas theicola]QNH26558.1 hypothetical protein G4Q83_20070 [Xanthomonas theicola]
MHFIIGSVAVWSCIRQIESWREIGRVGFPALKSFSIHKVFGAVWPWVRGRRLLCCLFVFPISLIVSYVWIVYEEDDWRLSEWMKDPMDFKKRFYGAILFVILIPMTILFLLSFRGQDARLLSISNNFYSMAMKGWISLAVAGAIAGGGFSFIRKVFIG